MGGEVDGFVSVTRRPDCVVVVPEDGGGHLGLFTLPELSEDGGAGILRFPLVRARQGEPFNELGPDAILNEGIDGMTVRPVARGNPGRRRRTLLIRSRGEETIGMRRSIGPSDSLLLMSKTADLSNVGKDIETISALSISLKSSSRSTAKSSRSMNGHPSRKLVNRHQKPEPTVGDTTHQFIARCWYEIQESTRSLTVSMNDGITACQSPTTP